jgi:Ricin-type beta-trefoil lectin domain-like
VATIILALAGMIAIIPVEAQQFRGYGQQQDRGYAIELAQNALRDRLQEERPNADIQIRFNKDSSASAMNHNRWRVTGTGSVFGNNRRRNFNYDATVNIRDGNVQNLTYNWLGNAANDAYPEGGGFPGGGRQDRGYAIELAQNALRDRLQQERPNADAQLRFNNDSNASAVSNNRWRVTGTGSVFGNNRRRNFNYDATVNIRDGNVQNLTYNWLGNAASDAYPEGGFPGSGRPSGGLNRPERPAGTAWVRGAITNAATGKSLDVPNWSREDGTPLQLWTFAGQANQRWEIVRLPGRNLYAIMNENSQRALDVSNRSRDDGAPVQQYRWNDQENQKWQIVSMGGGFYRIVNLNSGKCLDVRNKNSNDGAEIHQWQCNGDRSQAWQLGR